MGQKAQTYFLKQFWEEYGLHGKRRLDTQSPKGREAVLAQLIQYASFTFQPPTRDIRQARRENFNSLLRTNKWQYCFACGGKAQVRHHIFLIKNGGSNSGKNIVRLCKPCHAEIHPWLREATPPGIYTRGSFPFSSKYR